jgi:hypothetical protein
VKSCGCNSFFEGALQNVPERCELQMVKFALQLAMQEDPFVCLRGYRKAC